MPTRPIREIISRKTVVKISPQRSVYEAAQTMRDSNKGAVLVVDETGQLTGIFTERDALNRVLAAGKDPHTTLIADVMTPSPETITPDHPFIHAMHLMSERNIRHLPVVERGYPVGLVSLRDAMGLEMFQFERDLEQREQIAEIIA